MIRDVPVSVTSSAEPNARELDALLAAVRRRITRARCARAALAGAIGSAALLFAAAIVPMTIHQGIASVVAPGLPAATALVALVRRRPAAAAVAQHVDREMALNELLSSAVAVRDRDDPASRSIVAMARSTAARIDAGRVRVARPSGSAVAAVVLVCGLGWIATMLASVNEAVNEQGERSAAARSTPAVAPETTFEPRSQPWASNVREEGQDAMASSVRREAESAGRSRIDDSEARESRRPGDSVGDAAGSRGSTDDARVVDLPRISEAERDARREAVTDRTAATGSIEGNTVAADERATDGPAMDGASVPREPIRSAETPSPAAARGRGGERHRMIDLGAIPARHRDLVKAYFDLEPTSAVVEGAVR